MYFTTVELNKHKPFTMEIMSHKTHPDLALTTVLACTAAFPFMFKPVCIKDKCYIDGGVLCNFPLDPCIENTDIEIDEILALRNIYENLEYTPTIPSTGFLEYARTLMRKTHKSLDMSSQKKYDVPNMISFECSECSDYGLWWQCIGDKDLRQRFVTCGEDETQRWLDLNNIVKKL